MTLSPASRDYLLAFADDEHCVGARHTAWIGLGPFLEEDLAFCSIAQDELGHAIGLYELLLDDDPDRSRSDLDDFALMRSPGDYRSCWLAEADCSDWNDSLVRHWLYDRAEALRWEALSHSADVRLVALAARAQREESFHLAHAEQFMTRLAAGDTSGALVDAVRRLLPLGVAQWVPVEREADAIADGTVQTSSVELAAEWERLVRDDLDRWELDIEWPDAVACTKIVEAQDSRRARSDVFAQLSADVQRVVLMDPAATW